jgi:hypothetical protein
MKVLRFQNGRELFQELELKRMKNMFLQRTSQLTLNSKTTVSTRTVRIFIKPDGPMDKKTLMHARMNVTLRPNVVVSNGMIAPGMDQNAI